MEEKQGLTNQQLENSLKVLRVKASVAKILCGGFFTAFGLSMIFMQSFPVGLALLVASIVFAFILSDSNKKIKKLLIDNIVGEVIREALGDTAEYNPTGVIVPGKFEFPFCYHIIKGDDHIKAVYNGLNIELGDSELLCEAECTDEDGHTITEKITVFKGQCLICDFGKELAGDVYVSEYNKDTREKLESNVTMDNEQFNKRFVVKADNPQDAYYLLTPHMMEYITAMADKSGDMVFMSFQRDGKLRVAVASGRDFFELGKSKANVEVLRQKFIDELRWFTDIIDTLRVEDTIYKKETDI